MSSAKPNGKMPKRDAYTESQLRGGFAGAHASAAFTDANQEIDKLDAEIDIQAKAMDIHDKFAKLSEMEIYEPLIGMIVAPAVRLHERYLNMDPADFPAEQKAAQILWHVANTIKTAVLGKQDLKKAMGNKVMRRQALARQIGRTD